VLITSAKTGVEGNTHTHLGTYSTPAISCCYTQTTGKITECWWPKI